MEEVERKVLHAVETKGALEPDRERPKGKPIDASKSEESVNHNDKEFDS